MSSYVTSNQQYNNSPITPSYPAHPPPAHQPQLDDDDDVKAPYDDLIDQYATPYRSNSKHKTFNLAGQTNGAPTYPLTHKKTNNSDASTKDLEGSTSEGADWGYPPGPPKVEEKKPNFWSSVRTTRSLGLYARLTVAFLDLLRFFGVSTLSAYCAR